MAAVAAHAIAAAKSTAATMTAASATASAAVGNHAGSITTHHQSGGDETHPCDAEEVGSHDGPHFCSTASWRETRAIAENRARMQSSGRRRAAGCPSPRLFCCKAIQPLQLYHTPQADVAILPQHFCAIATGDTAYFNGTAVSACLTRCQQRPGSGAATGTTEL